MQEHDQNLLLDPPVAERWKTVLSVRHEFAAKLDQMANEIPRDRSKHLRSISRWFKGPAKLEDALQRPDVMAVCLPLIKLSTSDQISSVEIEQAARSGFCSIGRNASASQHLFRLLAYPILILLISSVLGILFSFWIAPVFDEMFAEFGIELPSVTKVVLGFAQVVRQWWWIVFAVPAGVVVVNWFLNLAFGAKSSTTSSWIDQKLMSTRDALASWAWHVSLLMEVGLTQAEAVTNAGISTGSSWLRRRSIEWIKASQPRDPSKQQPFMFNPKFQLLNSAMRLQISGGKIELMKEVAHYYWDRNRTAGDWWVQWLAAAILWLVGAAVFIAIISLFMPLIAIVSGLTSFKS